MKDSEQSKTRNPNKSKKNFSNKFDLKRPWSFDELSGSIKKVHFEESKLSVVVLLKCGNIT